MTALTDAEALTRLLIVAVVGVVVAVALTALLLRWARRRGEQP